MRRDPTQLHPLPSPIPPATPRRLPPPALPEPSGPSRDYIRPTHAEAFRCIGSACEETCCQSWGVPIDQGTYEKYRSHETMKQHLGTLIVLNTSHPTTADYARIPLTTNSVCPFLDAERLCGIQKKFGAAMLSTTCATYPRAIESQAGEPEEALHLSCPEAARLTLLNPNLLARPPWRAASAHLYKDFHRDANRLPHDYQPRLALREFVLLHLSDRGYPLWRRLHLLGDLTRRLQLLATQNGISVASWVDANPARVAKLLAGSARTAAQPHNRAALDRIAPDPSQQLSLLLELLRQRLAEPPVPTRMLECIAEFEAGLGIPTATSEAQILSAYRDGYQLFYKPLMDRHPHLIENVLLNYVFKNSFPFGRPTASPAPDAESEHVALCVYAALAQTLLIGIAANHREAFATAHVVKLVQSLAKTFEHSKRAIEQIAEFVRTHNLGAPRGIALLLQPPAAAEKSSNEPLPIH